MPNKTDLNSTIWLPAVNWLLSNRKHININTNYLMASIGTLGKDHIQISLPKRNWSLQNSEQSENDWKSNYPIFKPTQMSTNDQVASRNLKAGDRILAEPPLLVRSLRSSYLTQTLATHKIIFLCHYRINILVYSSEKEKVEGLMNSSKTCPKIGKLRCSD